MYSKSIIFVVLSVCALSMGQDKQYHLNDNTYAEPLPLQLIRFRRSLNDGGEPAASFEYLATEPLYRVRRQTVFGGVTPGNPGTTATIGASGTLFNQNGHRLDGHGQVSRTYSPTGPTSVGAGLDYQGPHVGASVNAEHTRHLGTNVGVTGSANMWRSPDGRSSLDANANYNRQFGGPFGTGPPNYGVGATFRHRF